MKKKSSYVALVFVSGVALAGFVSYSAGKEAIRERKIEKEIETLRAEALTIQKENNFITERIAYLETPEFQEKVAKEKLNLQKPDENVVVVKPSTVPEVAGVETNDKQKYDNDTRSNYLKWWESFFGYEG
jgi:cell division protein FtsB